MSAEGVGQVYGVGGFHVGEVWQLKSGKRIRIVAVNAKFQDIEFRYVDKPSKKGVCYASNAAKRWTKVSEPQP